MAKTLNQMGVNELLEEARKRGIPEGELVYKKGPKKGKSLSKEDLRFLISKWDEENASSVEASEAPVDEPRPETPSKGKKKERGDIFKELCAKLYPCGYYGPGSPRDSVIETEIAKLFGIDAVLEARSIIHEDWLSRRGGK